MIHSIDHLIVVVRDLDAAENNYTKLLGKPPVWRGAHKELGTTNSIFNFENTYLELLSGDGHGPGSAFVSRTLEQNGEGLTGIAFGTEDMNRVVRTLKTKVHGIYEPFKGEGCNFLDGRVENGKRFFCPPNLIEDCSPLSLNIQTETCIGSQWLTKQQSTD